MNYSDKYKVIWLTPMRTATRSCAEIQKKLGFDRSAVHGINIPKDKEDYYFDHFLKDVFDHCFWSKFMLFVNIFYSYFLINPILMKEFQLNEDLYP